MGRSLIIMMMCLQPLLLMAQIPEGMDTVSVQKRTVLILKDTSFLVKNDTILLLPDSIVQRIRQQAGETDFYLKLKERLSRKKATRELYDALVSEKDKKKPPARAVVPPHVLKYNEAKGKIIRAIRFKKLDVFGTSINDTTRYSDQWLVKFANAFHVNTHSRIIRNNIFFETGDRLDPDALKDSERYLRSLDYIKDARIIVIDRGDSDQVEILIITKDVFSLSADINYSDIDKFRLGITDNNILGFGHELRNEILYDAENDPEIGYAGRYRINSIGKTFIRADMEFVTSEPLDRFGVRFERQFITPEIRWAGGVSAFGDRRELGYEYPDTTIYFDVGQDEQELWLGHSLVLQEEGEIRSNLILSGLYANHDYYERPFVSADTNQLFLDRQLYMMSFGVSQRYYEKGRLIAAFGRTEDIPLGYTAQLLIGHERNELYSRNYWGGRVEAGTFTNLGYFRPVVEVGGYLRDGDWEQALIRVQTGYFSNLYRFNKFQFRQFFSIGYTTGINRYTNEYIWLDEDTDVRGLEDNFLRGSKKLRFNWETVAFTPYYVLGFRFALFAFADLAIINDVNKNLFDNKLYQGYGIGVRVRNDNLAINELQIRLAFYPNPAPGDSRFGADFSGRPTVNIPDLRIDKPLPIQYR